jgi:hypothetical protein
MLRDNRPDAETRSTTQLPLNKQIENQSASVPVIFASHHEII